MKGSSRFLLCAVIAGVVAFVGTKLYAAEHAGKEHAGATHEHAGTPQVEAPKPVEPTHEEIRMAMQTYALEVTNKNGGFFPIHDDKTGQDRKLTFQRVHERVGKLSTRDGYFSCADFTDQTTEEALDVDFWVTMKEGGQLEVTASEVHKVNGKPRFTYNEKDEKIMLE